MPTSYTVELSAWVCSQCGLLYGYVKEFEYGCCPGCAQVKINRLNEKINNLEENEIKYHQKEKALRSVISRFKNIIVKMKKNIEI